MVSKGSDCGQVMTDEEISDPEICLKLLEKVDDGLANDRIQGRGDLITQNDFGLSRERAGEVDPLFLAARQLSRQSGFVGRAVQPARATHQCAIPEHLQTGQ